MKPATNSIFMLRPWKSGPLWAFDDEAAGLRAEPFALNASQVIDALCKRSKVKPDKEGKITLMFSANPFPDAVQLDLLDVQPYGSGVTYSYKGMEAWLCPAFYCYFGQAPKQLFALAL